ncbi:MAG: M15 family metallopeptidase [Bacillota bacterium]
MRQHRLTLGTALLIAAAIAALVGCSEPAAVAGRQAPPASSQSTPAAPPSQAPQSPPKAPPTSKEPPAIQVLAKPAAVAALVNKQFRLPEDYRPTDLVEPKVPFIFKEQHEKRLMRAEAARALEAMFTAAEKDGIYLAGVSGFRSYETQKALFAYYVRTQGEEMARKYSAEAGHSEHQTGLAMDVSGSTGACAVDDCFAETPEARWLAEHAPEYGFIIRYPKGKEAITGYNYEPWHLRYVGLAMSREIAAKGLTLEEYLSR